MLTLGEIDPGAAVAAFVGPIVAVGITLWLQGRDRSRDRKEFLLRQMLATRLNPADPGYNVAMTLVPIEFRHHSAVRTAHKDFLAAANRGDGKTVQERQDELVLAMMRALGFKTESARDVVREPYSSVGHANALREQQDALRAMPRLATAMERLAAASEGSQDILLRATAGTDAKKDD